MDYPNIVYGHEEEIFNSYTREGPMVGTKMMVEDGRLFRFAENGAAALVVGNLNQGEVPHATNFLDEAIGTLAAGVTVLTGIGASGASMAISALVNGYVRTDTAVLPLMRIKDNTLITLSAETGTITLYNPTPSAIVAGRTVSYFKNPWRDVIIHDSPNTAVLTGVCKLALPIAYFGWLQTAGPASVYYKSDTTAVAGVGDPVGVSQAINGAVSGVASAAEDTDEIVGTQLGIVESTGEQMAVFLRLE